MPRLNAVGIPFFQGGEDVNGFLWIFISSCRIKNAARCKGNVAGLVPKHVEKALQEKFV